MLGRFTDRGTNMNNTQLNWLKWKSNSLKDPWAVTEDGTSYMVSTYHHGTEIIVTGDDPKGNNFLYQEVDTVEAGKAVAQASEDQRRS
jgi:hypothetical protein